MPRIAAVLILAVVPALGADVFRYGRFEHTFTAEKDYANPLKEEVLVRFEGPGGARAEVLAFWDGGRRWKVRYSPETTGNWTFRSAASDASDKGLHQQSGKFKVSSYRGNNDLYKKGPPQLSANRRYFVQGYGKPWFWLGDTAWNGALLATAEEWQRYLADRAAKRFTAIQLVTTQWRAGRADEKGQVAFTGIDAVRVNPAFFERLDQRMNAVNDAGLVAVPVVLWALTSKDRESPGEVLPQDQAVLLARYIVSRYGAHQVIWMLGGDGNYEGAANVERWKQIGRAVFPKGRWRRPVSLHPRGMRAPWQPFKDEEWLDVFAYQSGHGSDAAKWRWNAQQGPAVDWQMEPPRPVVDTEINYEGHLSYRDNKVIDDAAVRRAAWYSVLAAPPAGVTYGAHGIWPWMRKAEVPLDHPRSGVAKPWTDYLEAPGAQQMTVLRDVLYSMEWWRLRPDRTLLASEPEDAEFRGYPMAARTDDAQVGLLYLPANPAVELDLSGFKGDVRAIWIDPRTGARRPAGKLRPAYGVAVKTPGEGDWLLLLRK
ncbi:MAG: DUF4038 domain-containing protein [Bryobacteraceae bacterium]|nr:DUF4038 domain-containing protein [Bryobacteraceae bacterium]